MKQRQANKEISQILAEDFANIVEAVLNKSLENHKEGTALINLTVVILDLNKVNSQFSDGVIMFSSDNEQQNTEHYPSIMDDKESLNAELEHLKGLYQIYNKRQQDLEMKQAIHGVKADTSIGIEMDLNKREMTKIGERHREISRKLER